MAAWMRRLTRVTCGAVTVWLIVGLVSAAGGAPSGGAGLGSHGPRVDRSSVPAGWVPVSYGNAQIWVPPSWALVSAGGAGCGSAPGVVILGSGAWCPPTGNVRAQPDVSIVTIRIVRTTAIGGDVAFDAHNIRVYGPGPAPVYVAPALGIEVIESGPLQPQVLRTLTYSPRAVALSRGSTGGVRHGWRSVSYAGVHLMVPSSWAVRRSKNAPSCANGVQLPLGGVTLAAAPSLPIGCVPSLALYEPGHQTQGVEVDDFWTGKRPASCAGPRAVNGVRLCVERSPAYGILTAEVFPPHHRPVTVQIGMAGDGITGRAVLLSLR